MVFKRKLKSKTILCHISNLPFPNIKSTTLAVKTRFAGEKAYKNM